MSKRILVIEDCAEVRELYEIALSVHGYGVVSAPDGLEAFKALEAELPDAIVLDIGLPIMSGWEVLEVIRDTKEWQHIPVVIITGSSSPAHMARGSSLGCTHYMDKPVALDELLLIVAQMVDVGETVHAVAV